MNIAAILLAAGASTRFGQNKLHYAVNGNTAMVRHCAQQIQRVFGNVTCVVRREDTHSIELLKIDKVSILHPTHDAAEFGDNIALGVGHTATADAWVICLADMPFIRDETLKSIGDALRAGARITAPVFQSRRGHPVGFAKPFGEHLMALHGSQGAKKLILQHGITEIECNDPGTLIDIDTQEDARKHRA